VKRQRIEHDLSAEEKHCAACQKDLHLLGEETSARYEYIPAQFLVMEDVCKKYAGQCTVKTATKPPQPLAKSSPGASVLAHVIVSKIADHLSLQRQGKIFSRLGVDIPDQTMGGWMRQSAELLSPLYERRKTFVLNSKVSGTDDTPVRVLDKSLPGTTRKGRFWPYVGDSWQPAADWQSACRHALRIFKVLRGVFDRAAPLPGGFFAPRAGLAPSRRRVGQ
jgi:transposase